VRKVAGAVTPVPGGVGPVTTACLLSNTVLAAERRTRAARRAKNIPAAHAEAEPCPPASAPFSLSRLRRERAAH